MLRRVVSVLVVVSALVGLSFVSSGPAVAATDPGTARPFPKAEGSCYTGDGPHAMAPNQMAALYGLTPLWEAGYKGEGKSIAILDPGEVPDETEVENFKDCFGIKTPLVKKLVGSGAEPAPAGEATLDVIIALTAAPELDSVYQFASPAGTENPLLVLLEAALDPANTGGRQVDAISVSFSMCEPRAKTGYHEYTADYVEKMNAVLKTAADRGITLFGDAGDSGAPNCAAHPVAEDDPDVALAAVGFPGTSPHAVSVGGSQFDVTKKADGSGEVTTERVWNELAHGSTTERMAGSGGTSILTEVPEWQKGFAPTAMRSVPDVTALAGSPYYAGNTNDSFWDGTSAATPFTAASWLVVLGALEDKGIPSPGFFGPVIYDLARDHYSTVFRDITVGDNDVWGKVGCCAAGVGYDKASGLGSVRWDQVAIELEAEHAASTTTTTVAAGPSAGVTPRFAG